MRHGSPGSLPIPELLATFLATLICYFIPQASACNSLRKHLTPEIEEYIFCKPRPFSWDDYTRAKRKIDGTPTRSMEDWPWLVRVEFLEGRYWEKVVVAGTGVLIAPNLVLTAAHPVLHAKAASSTLLRTVQNMLSVYYASPARFSFGARALAISHFFFHQHAGMDLVIIKLTVSVLCIRGSTALVTRSKGVDMGPINNCRSASWGKDRNGQCPPELRHGTYRLFKQDDYLKIKATGKRIGDKTPADTTGDSGAPLMCRNPANNNKWTLYGVLSEWYPTDNQTRVSVFRSVGAAHVWIDHIIKAHAKPNEIRFFEKYCPDLVE